MFMVLRQVESHDLLAVRHPDLDQDVYEFYYEIGYYETVNGHRGHSHKLYEQLARVAVEKTVSARRIYRLRREKSNRERAQHAADAVDSEGIKGVVVSQSGLYLGHSNETDNARRASYRNGGSGRHEARSGSDRCKTCDRAGDGAEDGRLSIEYPFKQCPGSACGGRCSVCYQESVNCHSHLQPVRCPR